jgi:hypothetical protein
MSHISLLCSMTYCRHLLPAWQRPQYNRRYGFGGLLKNYLERIWRDSAVTQVGELFHYLPVGPEEYHNDTWRFVFEATIRSVAWADSFGDDFDKHISLLPLFYSKRHVSRAGSAAVSRQEQNMTKLTLLGRGESNFLGPSYEKEYKIANATLGTKVNIYLGPVPGHWMGPVDARGPEA